MTTLRQKLFAEAVGTFALVFAGTTAIVVNHMSGVLTHVGVALTFGLVIFAMISALGDVSGAHLNPAVTLGFWWARRIDAFTAGSYAVSQCFGAVLASLVVRGLFSTAAQLGATIPSGTLQQSFVMECILTAG